MGVVGDTAVATVLQGDPRLQRLFILGKKINDDLAKIRAASEFLASPNATDDASAVELARSELMRELLSNRGEARQLIPALDEIIANLEKEEQKLESERKLNIGLAKIDGLSGKEKQVRFSEAAVTLEAKALEMKNLIQALGALGKDLGAQRRYPHLCPRCSSAEVSYLITPSDLGYSLYRCDDCANSWRIIEFSMRAD